MVGALQQYFIDNEDLQQVEVEDFLSELMNNEFDTVVDDCSLPQVAQQVCSLFQLCEQGRLLEVRGQINALREKKSSAGRAKATAAQSHDQDEEADEDCSEEQQEAMECEVASQGASVSEQLPHHKEEDEEEDGWTTVVRRKK
ncbi:hypothetical protein DNTS_009513 [Danionella cerebrum]|uniref:Pre-rRNA-processing protein TSR2 homolog n=1 Tax=Danionella cerebrum TaxID=2873325 RepID=A0A553P551_9TELE|nr:hypothetical protein DNTS_009513 [Danionella translucida]